MNNPRLLNIIRTDDNADGRTCNLLQPLVEGGILTSWKDILCYWESGSTPIPDVYIGDIHFSNDVTTPFQHLRKNNPTLSIPTGLSHAKPFAAMARALDRPIGFALATQNPGKWEEEWNHSDDVHKSMGALAAHEAGELAALLADPVKYSSSASFDEKVRACFTWIKDKAAVDFSEAVAKALTDYRRKLLEKVTDFKITVDLNQWTRLQNWCNHRSSEKSTLLPLDHAIGIKISYGNADDDYISLASIFADSPAVQNVVEKKVIPRSAFECNLQIDESSPLPWELDENGYPRIGLFLSRLIGDIHAKYTTISNILGQFPYETTSIVRPLRDVTDKDVDRGLVILLQVLRWEWMRKVVWNHGIQADGWCIDKMRFDEGVTCSKLANILSQVINTAKKYSTPMTREEVLERTSIRSECPAFINTLDYENTVPIIWIFNTLVEIGALQSTFGGVEGETYLYNPAFGSINSCPRVPRTIPAGFTKFFNQHWQENRYDYDDGFEHLRRFLRESLGHDGDNRAIGVMLYRAFCADGSTNNRCDQDEENRRGIEFLKNFFEGHGPDWVYQILATYANENIREDASNPFWLEQRRGS